MNSARILGHGSVLALHPWSLGRAHVLCIEFQPKSLLYMVEERFCSRHIRSACVLFVFPQCLGTLLDKSRKTLWFRKEVQSPKEERCAQISAVFSLRLCWHFIKLLSLPKCVQLVWDPWELQQAVTHAAHPAEVSSSDSLPPFLLCNAWRLNS